MNRAPTNDRARLEGVRMRKLVLVVGLVAVAFACNEPVWQPTPTTALTVEERIGNCKTHECIIEAGAVFPSLCHLKVNGEFTSAVVECDADCKWLRRADPDVFDCWRVETCDQDPACVRLFEVTKRYDPLTAP